MTPDSLKIFTYFDFLTEKDEIKKKILFLFCLLDKKVWSRQPTLIDICCYFGALNYCNFDWVNGGDSQENKNVPANCSRTSCIQFQPKMYRNQHRLVTFMRKWSSSKTRRLFGSVWRKWYVVYGTVSCRFWKVILTEFCSTICLFEKVSLNPIKRPFASLMSMSRALLQGLSLSRDGLSFSCWFSICSRTRSGFLFSL